ncbi:MAG: hypothetical protein MJ201_01345 [Mycoplasmoidaceae bacterium]|nr:hypothetical protein [Mycoplasmoidaceae bacterium]
MYIQTYLISYFLTAFLVLIHKDIEMQHVHPAVIKNEKLNTDSIGVIALSTKGQIKPHSIPQNKINPDGIMLARLTHNLFSINLEHNDFIPMIKEKIICKSIPKSAK